MSSARYEILHETRFAYEQPVLVSRQLTHLAPRKLPHQLCESHSVAVDPEPTERVERDDYFGNHVVQFTALSPHRELVVSARSRVAVSPHGPRCAAAESPSWEEVAAAMHRPTCAEHLDAAQFCFASLFVPLVTTLAPIVTPIFRPQRPLLEAVIELTHLIHEQFRFDAKATTVSTPLEEVIEKRHGVCQDFAHLALACLRSLGIPARYVSGYLLTKPPPGRPRLIGADASHAWLSVFIPGLGWVDTDPTNDLLPDTEHITVAWGRDFGDVSPLRGVILGGGEHSVEVSVTVLPLEESTGNVDAPLAG